MPEVLLAWVWFLGCGLALALGVALVAERCGTSASPDALLSPLGMALLCAATSSLSLPAWRPLRPVAYISSGVSSPAAVLARIFGSLALAALVGGVLWSDALAPP